MLIGLARASGCRGGAACAIVMAFPCVDLGTFQAFGTWFTFWSQYTEDEAKGEVARWRNDDLPIDIWALDMNWRDTPHGHEPSCPDPVQCERHYNCPNVKLFPDFANSSASKGSGWFDFLKEKGVRTYCKGLGSLARRPIFSFVYPCADRPTPTPARPLPPHPACADVTRGPGLISDWSTHGGSVSLAFVRSQRPPVPG